jgi:hypothetical protein
MKYSLFDLVNMRTISQHRTLKSASRAQVRHSPAAKSTNGKNSYFPTIIFGNGQPITNPIP